MWLSDQQSALRVLTAEIGVGLVSGGIFFLFVGVVLFFDATLLALGNVLFVAGIAMLIGPQRTLTFFARKQKIRGTLCFFTGMALVFLRLTFLGILVETVGFLNLFGCVERLTQRLLPGDPQLPAAGARSRPAALHAGRGHGDGPTCRRPPLCCIVVYRLPSLVSPHHGPVERDVCDSGRICRLRACAAVRRGTAIAIVLARRCVWRLTCGQRACRR